MQKTIVGMFIVLALAGCTSGDGGVDQTQKVDPDSFELDPNLGAIDGLLVDDVFRPIELGEVAESQYQDIGFILLQENALEVYTNEAGEFTVINLEPGRYTLRTQADRHEAAGQSVEVVAGVFTEVTIQARRLIEDSSSIITQEQTMFTECSAETPVVSSAWLPCSADLSLEGARTDFRSNFSEYMDEATYMVVEATFNQQGSYTIEVRRLDPDTGGIGAIDYASCETNEPYIRMQMVPGEAHEQDGCDTQTNLFDMSQEFQTIMFAWSDTHELLAPTPVGGGVGVKLGVRAQVIQTLFLGEPEVDVDSYCVLCD
jgi:hypothetical protein